MRGGKPIKQSRKTGAMCLLVFYIYTVVSEENFSATNTDPYCGGTILNENTILTAAHCFGNLTNQIKLVNQSAYISAGILDFREPAMALVSNKFVQHIEIKNIDLHPQYRIDKHPETGVIAHNFDAAIVRLDTPLKFNDHVKPACLPGPDFKSNVAIISGWGNKKITEGNDFLIQSFDFLMQSFDFLVEIKSKPK